MNRIAKALAPFSGAAAAVIFSAAVFAAAPARALGADPVQADSAVKAPAKLQRGA
jgi:hypothetical protein